jgi:hypothetical protein
MLASNASELPRLQRRGLAGTDMFFLLRACFWICIVWLVMPNPIKGARPQASILASTAPSLVVQAIGTAASLCRQQPAACQSVIRNAATEKPQPGAKFFESTAEADVPVPRPVARPVKRKAS